MSVASPEPERPATPPPPEPLAPGRRLPSLDQFRGYTVAGMMVVNFLGGFAAVPAILKHHNTYCSYADTIMPQFLLAVGAGASIALGRRLRTLGPAAAYRHAVWRSIGLIVLGFAIYHLDGGAKTWAELRDIGVGGFLRTAFQRNLFQTLVHIGVTTLWVLPVLNASVAWRVAWLVGSAVLHLGLSWAFYLDWVWNRPGIDGGPLGFLTWTTPLLVGSIAMDALRARGPRAVLPGFLIAAVGLMALGYAFSCLGTGTWAPPPFVKPDAAPITLWTMSQRTGSVSYLTFSTGFALAVWAVAIVVCDLGGARLALFDTFGRNALAAYVLHPIVAGAVKPWMPPDAPAWYVLAGFALYYALTTAFLRWLERESLFIRL